MSRESALSAIRRGDLSELQHVQEKSQWNIGSEPLDSKGQTALYIACANGHLDIVQYLVNEKKCSVAVEDVYGHTPLMLSLINKHWIVADFLLKSAPNSDINEQKVTFISYNKSLVAKMANEAFVESCKSGYFELMKYLTRELGVHISEEDIQSACDNGHWEMFMYLKWKRGDSGFVDIGPPHLTPLHDNVKVALRGELWEAAKVLLMLQQRSSHMSLGLSSKGLKQLMKVVAIGNLNSACSHGYLQVVEYYHRVGILSSEQLGGAPLETARSSGHLHIVHYLLKHCKCTIPGDMSEIHVACSLGDVEKVKTALDRYGSAILSTTDRYATAAIHYAAYEPAVLNMIVSEVNERGILLSILDRKGNIPLHHCIMSQCDESVKLFIAVTVCDVNRLNFQGVAPLHTACEQSNIAALQLLVACERCDLNISNSNGDTALHIAVCSEPNSVQMVQCLLQSDRCDINLTNGQHYTPLHIACKQGSIEVVEMLVADERCDPYIQDANGDTAFYAAVCSEVDKDEKVQYLLGSGRWKLVNNDGNCTTELTLIINHILPGLQSLVGSWYIGVSVKKGKDTLLLKKDTPLSHIKALLYHMVYCNSITSLLFQSPYSQSTVAEIFSHQKMLPANINELLFRYVAINGNLSYNSHQEKLLHAACRGGYCDMTVALLTSGADVEAVDTAGNTAIHIACYNIRLDCLKILLHCKRCDPNQLNADGDTALHIVCRMKLEFDSKLSILQALLSTPGIDPGITNKVGALAYEELVRGECNLLNSACTIGASAVVEFLLKNGADVLRLDDEGNAPIHIACKNVRFDCLKVLLSCKVCDPNQKNADGDTALHIMCKMKKGNACTRFLQLLLETQRCDANQLNKRKETPLHVACRCNSVDVVQVLVAKKCDVNVQDRHADTALHVAVDSDLDNIQKVQCLVGSDKCDPNVLNRKSITPLHVACRLSNVKVLEMLVADKRCDVNIQDGDGNTALHIAVYGMSKNNHLERVKLLLGSSRCDLNVANMYGSTPLHVACTKCNIPILEILVAEERCHLNIQDKNGDTALHKGVDNALIVKCLLESGRSKCDIFNREGKTPFHKAIATANMASIECFLKNGVDILQSTNNKVQNTPIHIACKHFRLDVLEKMLGCKSCDPNQHNAEGDTALHIVCRMRMTTHIILQYLHVLMSTPGINPEIVNHENLTPFEIVGRDGRTLLHSACVEANSAMVRFLVENGADILRFDRHGDAPIHIACKLTYGRLDILKVLVGCKNRDPNQQNAEGDTALHIVCRINALQCVQILISTPGINPEIVNHAGLTPIEVAGTNYSVIDTIRGFLENKNIQAYLKIFVIGNSGTGKSTLIKAVTTEASRWLKYSPFSRAKYVNPDDVPPHTAGIVPIPFSSNHFGNAVLYDFAGQHEYYSSHAAVMENLILPSPPLFLLLIDISKPMEEIKEELVYWWHFINNQSQRATIPPHVILGGSHKDLVKSRGEDELEKLEMMIKDCIKDIPVIFQFVDYFPLDCRKLVSRGLSALLTQFKATCQILRQGVDVYLHCHILKAFLTTREFQTLIYCEVAKVMERIESDNAPLPRSYNQLIPLFASLSDQGHILLLQNHTDESKSWVILKPEELLADVNGSIFAPDYFKKYFHHFAMSTGVVCLSKLKEQFAKYNHEVIVKYLIHLEFCFQIKDQHTLNMTTNNEVHMSLTTETTEYQEKYYFFPSLVRVENPTDVCQPQISISFKCGWLYMCRNFTEQLTARFLHVLILRLAFACEHPDDLTAMESVVLLRSCSVWKRGIAWWTNDGIETIVEVGLQCHWVAVMMRCPDTKKVQCAELRSKVIRTVLKAKNHFCPAITMKEFLIAPSSLQYPFEGRKLTLYSMREIAKVVIEGKEFAKDTEGKNPISIPQLLPFEPYHNMGDLIAKFFSGGTSLAVTPKDLTRIAEKCHDKLAGLKTAFKPDISSFQRDCVKADCTEVERCVALFHILQRRGFKAWTDFEQEFSRFSIFCGHNPMVRMI